MSKILYLNAEYKDTLYNAAKALASTTCLSDLQLEKRPYITLRIGNKPDSEFVGGFNIFGQKFGDFGQDINLSFIY